MLCCDAKKKFIHTWGQLGVNWGICRTMAQVHALLLVSNKSLCADTIMEELEISRGNANMNIRALIEWGLIYRSPRQNGDRKEYFIAEKDISVVFKQIVKNRKKKELEPLLELLNQCDNVKEDCSDSAEFQRIVGELKVFSKKADLALDNLIRLESHWLSGTLMKMIK
jgi:DNA-binding transcriptional regulator GbsR (MarR family)